MLPLGDYQVLSTRDVDEARERIGRELCPNVLTVTGEPAQFHARLHAVRMGAVRLHYVGYGAQVRVSHEHRNHTYAMHVPLAGTQGFSIGSHRVVSSGSQGAMISPGTQLRMDLEAGNHRLLVYLDQASTETTLRQLLGRPLDRPLRFDLGVDLTSSPGRRWLGLVDLVRCDLEQTTRLVTHPLALQHLQQLMLTGLLLFARHTHSQELHENRAPVGAPRCIRRAVALIEARAHEPLTVEAIAGATGIAVRSLQHGFRTHLDTTPMAYLRRVRLGYAHAALREATPDQVSVTTVALRWGFLHLGRFAQAYRAAYGELPSTTLQR